MSTHRMRLLCCLLIASSCWSCSTVCSGALIGRDVVVTMHHCIGKISLVAATVYAPSVAVGDELSFMGLHGAKRGFVASVDDDDATLTVEAQSGDSGAPVWNLGGELVGFVVSRRLGDNAAIVRLLRH